MTTELGYLLATAVLAAVLWLPVVAGYVLTRGFLRPQDYAVAPSSPLPDWTNRAFRAHANMVENFSAFAAVVLIGHVLGVSSPVTQAAVAVFFYARVAHAVVHITGFGVLMARTVIFVIGWAATMVLAYEVWRLSPVI